MGKIWVGSEDSIQNFGGMSKTLGKQVERTWYVSGQSRLASKCTTKAVRYSYPFISQILKIF